MGEVGCHIVTKTYNESLARLGRIVSDDSCSLHIVRRHRLLILRKHKFKYRRRGLAIEMDSDSSNVGTVSRMCEQQRE